MGGEESHKVLRISKEEKMGYKDEEKKGLTSFQLPVKKRSKLRESGLMF